MRNTRPKTVGHLDYWILATLAFLCYVLFFHELSGIGLVGPDEPRYAAVAQGMYESGDYLTPRLLGQPWFEKPVLMYWLAAIGYTLFGVGEAGARFPSALAATASVFLLYWCGRRLFGLGVGLGAAVILATSTGFFSLGRAASMDMLMTASLTAALGFFLVAYESEGRSRRWYFYAFYASLGLGVLAKGPVAILLPVAALTLFVLWRGVPGEWRKWHLEGVSLTVLVAAPWYIAVAWVNGSSFFREFLLDHNVRRFATDVYGHEQPFYFFVPVFLLMMFPWTFLALPALRRRLQKNEYVILAWAIVPFVFFSLSGSKLPAYILPVVPPVALLFAREIARSEITRGYRFAVFLQAALWICIGLTLTFLGEMINFDLGLGGPAALTVSLLAGGILIAIGLWLPPPFLGVFNTVWSVALVFLITAAIFPGVQSLESMRPWKGELDTLLSETQDVVLYKPDRWMEYGLEFYRDGPIRTARSEQELIEIADSGARTLCIAQGPVLDELSSSDGVAIEVVRSVGDQVAFWIWSP